MENYFRRLHKQVTRLHSGFRWVLIGVISLTLVSFPAYFVSMKRIQSHTQIVTVQATRMEDRLDLLSKIEPANPTIVAAKVDGLITEKFYVNGQHVNSGDLLIRMSNQELSSRVASGQIAVSKAQAHLAKLKGWNQSIEVVKSERMLSQAHLAELDAEKRLRDINQLFSKGIVPRSEVDDTTMQVFHAHAQVIELAENLAATKRSAGKIEIQIALAELADAEFRLSSNLRDLKNLEVHAPKSGRIFKVVSSQQATSLPKELVIGTIVRRGDSFLTIVDENLMLVRGQIDETDLRRVKPGLPVEVSGPAFDDSCAGRIAEIAEVPDQSPLQGIASFGVSALLKPTPEQGCSSIRFGMSAKMSILLAARPSILIPAEAVRKSQGRDFVEVSVAPSATRAVLVTLGSSRGNEIEVLSGLKPGDQITIPFRSP